FVSLRSKNFIERIFLTFSPFCPLARSYPLCFHKIFTGALANARHRQGRGRRIVTIVAQEFLGHAPSLKFCSAQAKKICECLRLLLRREPLPKLDLAQQG